MGPHARLRAVLRHTAPDRSDGTLVSPAAVRKQWSAAAAAASASADEAEPKPPNIIWFLGDQHRAQATGYAGKRTRNTLTTT